MGIPSAFDIINSILDNIMLYGIEYYGRFYSTYRGIVVSNEDPEKQGRILAKVPELTGDESLGRWAWPKGVPAGPQFGLFHPPDEGAAVWIEFEHGDLEAPIYSGGWWAKEEGGGQLETPTDLQKNPPTAKGWYTSTGQALMFEEEKDKEQVRLQWHGVSKNNYSFIVIDKNGSIQIQNHQGTMLYLNAEDGKEGITLIDKHGNMMASDKDGIKMVQKDGTLVDLQKDLVQVIGKKVTVATESLGVTGGTTLGQGAVDGIPLGNKLLALWTQAVTIFATHIHGTTAPGAPTSPPTGAPWPTYSADVNSRTNKVK